MSSIISATWAARSTITWVMLAGMALYLLDWPTALAALAGVLLVQGVVYYLTGHLGRWLPGYGDWLRVHERREGYRLIAESNLCSARAMEGLTLRYQRVSRYEHRVKLPTKATRYTTEAVAERIQDVRTLAGAADTRVVTRGAYHHCYFSSVEYPDPLASPVPWPGPSDTLEAVELGKNSDGEAVTIPLHGTHTLIMGMTGSGKSGLLWSIVSSALHANAQVSIIDLKGGVEFVPLMGQCRVATTPESAVDLLDELHGIITERQDHMARIGMRQWTGQQHVLVIDELALLESAPQSALDREMQKALTRANALHSVILRIGRAVGVTVVSAMQDSLKESSRARDLYTQQIALRMATATQTRLALPTCYDQAPAHLIPQDLPGVGYLVCEGKPQRFRAYQFTRKEMPGQQQETPELQF